MTLGIDGMKITTVPTQVWLDLADLVTSDTIGGRL